jgi:hypothetical protein
MYNPTLEILSQPGKRVVIVIDDRDVMSLPDQKQADLRTNPSATHDNDLH